MAAINALTASVAGCPHGRDLWLEGAIIGRSLAFSTLFFILFVPKILGLKRFVANMSVLKIVSLIFVLRAIVGRSLA